MSISALLKTFSGSNLSFYAFLVWSFAVIAVATHYCLTYCCIWLLWLKMTKINSRSLKVWTLTLFSKGMHGIWEQLRVFDGRSNVKLAAATRSDVTVVLTSQVISAVDHLISNGFFLPSSFTLLQIQHWCLLSSMKLTLVLSRSVHALTDLEQHPWKANWHCDASIQN